MNSVEFSEIPGVKILKAKRIYDERGFFEKPFDKASFDSMKLNTQLDSIAISSNTLAGTLRGMHFQSFPFAEEKLVVCISGSIFDVVVDLRIDSPTYRKWAAISLNNADERLLYLPAGVAHGYQTLEDDSVVLYGITSAYEPANAFTLHFSDSTLNIAWPIPISAISKKDTLGVSLEDALDLWSGKKL
jgi:dTDP-4-dehydrorhamnose 3,5-epimerase